VQRAQAKAALRRASVSLLIEGRRSAPWLLAASAWSVLSAGGCSQTQTDHRAATDLLRNGRAQERGSTTLSAWCDASRFAHRPAGVHPIGFERSAAETPGTATLDVESPYSTFAAHSVAAHAEISRLGRAQFDERRRVAAQILDELADALAAAAREPHAVHAQLQELRFQSQRLARHEGPGFPRAGWIKRGLLSAVSGLERVAPEAIRLPLEPWTDAARSASEAIDAGSPFGFGRATMQDAFRSVADAFMVAAQVAATCE
jgi:hypothetical protein